MDGDTPEFFLLYGCLVPRYGRPDALLRLLKRWNLQIVQFFSALGAAYDRCGHLVPTLPPALGEWLKDYPG